MAVSQADLGNLRAPVFPSAFGDFGGRPKAQQTATIGDGVAPVARSKPKGVDQQTAQLVGRVDELGDVAVAQADGIGGFLDRVGDGAFKVGVGGFALLAAQGLGGDSQTLTQAAPESQGQVAPPSYLAQVAGLLNNVSGDYQDLSPAASGQLGRWDVAQDPSQSNGMSLV